MIKWIFSKKDDEGNEEPSSENEKNAVQDEAKDGQPDSEVAMKDEYEKETDKSEIEPEPVDMPAVEEPAASVESRPVEPVMPVQSDEEGAALDIGDASSETESEEVYSLEDEDDFPSPVGEESYQEPVPVRAMDTIESETVQEEPVSASSETETIIESADIGSVLETAKKTEDTASEDIPVLESISDADITGDTAGSSLKIGVYVCDCGTNIANALDVGKLVEFSAGLEGVAVSKNYKLLCAEDGKEFIKNEVIDNGLTRVVIAACSPKQHESTFKKVLEEAGLNPYLLQMVNIREQVAWVTSDKAAAIEKAEAFIRAAVNRVSIHEPLMRKKIDCSPDSMVIGAGVAGIQAALTLAQKGRQVCVVEKNPSIGGKIVRYEDVFPNLECASCMMEPKLDEFLHSDNIDVLTYSEVEGVLGFNGNFVIDVKKKARYVNLEKCIGCGACYDACPVSVKNEYNENLNDRKAIYTPHLGALPNVPVIDKENCLRFHGQECTKCQEACVFDAIEYDQQDEIVQKKVGGVVLAAGFDIFDCSMIENLGYGKYSEVYNSLEFERLLSSTGPSEGKIQMKNGEVPKSVVIIHCIGSRDDEYNSYCSSVCCMYSLKFSNMIREHLGEEVRIAQIYRDLTLPGKGYQQFCNRVSGKGVEFIRVADPNKVRVSEEGGCLSIEHENGTVSADMVVLSPGIGGGRSLPGIADMFSLNLGDDGFLEEQHGKVEPVSTTTDGVFIAGCAQGPMDIQSAVAQGEAAAGKILSSLVPGEKLELESIVAVIDEDVCSGCKTCIPLCPYKAITYDQDKKISVVNDVLCKGCGTCAAACPSGAAESKHFTSEQIYSELAGLVKGGDNE